MKKIVLLQMLLLAGIFSFAQSKDEVAVSANVRAVHQAIFIDKDSATMERLFAEAITYGHSGGKLENREETIKACSHNKSTYTNMAPITAVFVIVNGKTAVTRYVLTATENKADGKSVDLKMNVLQTWTKVKKEWKMVARQATKLS